MTIHKRLHTNRTNGPVSDRGDTSSTRRYSGARNTAVKHSASDRTGNPKARFDRYIKLAQSAEVQGEKSDSENYYQHAEHYLRVMNLAKTKK